MKKWMVRVQEVLKKLEFAQKAKDKALTASEWDAVATEYQQLYGSSLAADREANEEHTPENKISDDLQNDISSFLTSQGVATPDSTEGKVAQLAKTAASQEKTIKDQKEVIKSLASETEKVSTEVVTGIGKTSAHAAILGFCGHSDKYLFGIESPAFERGKFYTDIMLTRQAHRSSDIPQSQQDAFRGVFTDFTSSIQNRFNSLSENGQVNLLDFNKMMAGESVIDYSDLTSTAGEYITRRSDLIIAYLRTLESVTNIFPTVSNIQNKEIAPTMSVGELSQGYREGSWFKGNVDFSADIYSVDDVMFKYKFSDLIALEKAYIGYLNKNEGSAVVKWSFIEWLVVFFVQKLISERNRRNVVGIATPEQAVAANPAMLSANGVLRCITLKEDEYRIEPHKDYKTYTSATIVDYVEGFWDDIAQILPSTAGYNLYLNAKHRNMYLRAYREKYGTDSDFNGAKGIIADVSPENIIWVPNMYANSYKMWVTTPGNVQLLEDKPNEMLGFQFVRDLESVCVISRWKEGAHIEVSGAKFESASALSASSRQFQYIFTNYPATELAAGAVTCDAKLNDFFVTSANAAATAITSITGAVAERVYRIECGNTANASTIAKSGDFSKIKSEWTPTAVGDFIELYPELEDETVTVDGKSVKRSKMTGKFLELRRKVTAS